MRKRGRSALPVPPWLPPISLRRRQRSSLTWEMLAIISLRYTRIPVSRTKAIPVNCHIWPFSCMAFFMGKGPYICMAFYSRKKAFISGIYFNDVAFWRTFCQSVDENTWEATQRGSTDKNRMKISNVWPSHQPTYLGKGSETRVTEIS